MADMLDYIEWRGDIDFLEKPLNEVDALILCQLSYLNFDGIVSHNFLTSSLTVQEVASKFISAPDYDVRSDVGALINPLSVDLLVAAGHSARFGKLFMSGYKSEYNESTEEQFAAVTFTYKSSLSSKWNFIAYRGTDDTIVGWKEDFNMGFMDIVPAQISALKYLENAGKKLHGSIYVGGHSKGGNIALYAASYASSLLQKRIEKVFDNDGPGFKKEFFEEKGYLSIKNKVYAYVPRLSIVGMLFNRPENCTAVVSGQKNMIMQHDPFSWHIKPKSFEECSNIGERSQFLCKTVNEWISGLKKEERELFVETIFSVLKSTEAKTNSEITANWFESSVKVVKAFSRLDPKIKDSAMNTLGMLFKIMLEEIPPTLQTKALVL